MFVPCEFIWILICFSSVVVLRSSYRDSSFLSLLFAACNSRCQWWNAHTGIFRKIWWWNAHSSNGYLQCPVFSSYISGVLLVLMLREFNICESKSRQSICKWVRVQRDFFSCFSNEKESAGRQTLFAKAYSMQSTYVCVGVCAVHWTRSTYNVVCVFSLLIEQKKFTRTREKPKRQHNVNERWRGDQLWTNVRLRERVLGYPNTEDIADVPTVLLQSWSAIDAHAPNDASNTFQSHTPPFLWRMLLPFKLGTVCGETGRLCDTHLLRATLTISACKGSYEPRQILCAFHKIIKYHLTRWQEFSMR